MIPKLEILQLVPNSKYIVKRKKPSLLFMRKE